MSEPRLGRRWVLSVGLGMVVSACSGSTPRPIAQSKLAARKIEPSSERPALSLPPRPSDSPSGSEFIAICEKLHAGEREIAIAEAIRSGNIPPFLRELVFVPLDRAAHRGGVWVTPDYLAVGSDDDFVRVPMSKRPAHDIARAADCLLPTSRIVDAIYESAPCKIESPAHGASSHMASTELYAQHNREIEARRSAATCALGTLVAGPKKDLVISAREAFEPGRLAIYGWFDGTGKPIQSVSLLHSEKYVDFSHGVRLVADAMEIDGHSARLSQSLLDDGLASFLSDEGRFHSLN